MRKALFISAIVALVGCGDTSTTNEETCEPAEKTCEVANECVAEVVEDFCTEPEECPTCPPAPIVKCMGLSCVGHAVTDPKLVCAEYADSYVRYSRFPNNTVMCICNDEGGICGFEDYPCGTTCRTDLLDKHF